MNVLDSGKQTGGARCIGAAISSTSTGPFTPLDKPLICDQKNGGSIDPSGFDDGTNRWIMWKVDGNALGGATTCTGGNKSGDYKPTPIKIQKVSRDGLKLQGSPKVILDNNGAGDDGVVEGPSMYKVQPGQYVSARGLLPLVEHKSSILFSAICIRYPEQRILQSPLFVYYTVTFGHCSLY